MMKKNKWWEELFYTLALLIARCAQTCQRLWSSHNNHHTQKMNAVEEQSDYAVTEESIMHDPNVANEMAGEAEASDSEASMKLIIMLADSSILLQVQPSCSISHMKELVRMSRHLPTDLDFKYMGRILDDSKSIREHGLKTGSVLYLMLRLLGGMKKNQNSIPSEGDILQVGDAVEVILPKSGKQESGTVRFIGVTEFTHGEWIGVETDKPNGKNDGTINGVTYFTCDAKHGLFVRREFVHKKTSGEEQEEEQSTMASLTQASQQQRTKPLSKSKRPQSSQALSSSEPSADASLSSESLLLAEIARLKQANAKLEEEKIDATEKLVELTDSLKEAAREFTNVQAVLTFQPGRIGFTIEEDGHIVSNVVEGGQGEQLGVKVGWRVLKVGNNDFDFPTLRGAARGKKPYQVMFGNAAKATTSEKRSIEVLTLKAELAMVKQRADDAERNLQLAREGRHSMVEHIAADTEAELQTARDQRKRLEAISEERLSEHRMTEERAATIEAIAEQRLFEIRLAENRVEEIEAEHIAADTEAELQTARDQRKRLEAISEQRLSELQMTEDRAARTEAIAEQRLFEIRAAENRVEKIEAAEEARLAAEKEARRAEENRLAVEAAKKAEEDAMPAKEARLAAEDEARRFEEPFAAEVAKKAQEEAKAAEEANSVAEAESRRVEEMRLAVELAENAEGEAKAAEEARIASEEDARRLAEERLAAEVAKKAEEESKIAEEARLASEHEARRLAEERLAPEAAKKAQEEAKASEEARLSVEEETCRVEEDTASATRCFISDLPQSYRDGSLKAHFSDFEGLVEDSVVLLVLDGGKLTAEITFDDQNVALAVANDSHELNGKKVKVKNKADVVRREEHLAALHKALDKSEHGAWKLSQLYTYAQRVAFPHREKAFEDKYNVACQNMHCDPMGGLDFKSLTQLVDNDENFKIDDESLQRVTFCLQNRSEAFQAGDRVVGSNGRGMVISVDSDGDPKIQFENGEVRQKYAKDCKHHKERSEQLAAIFSALDKNKNCAWKSSELYAYAQTVAFPYTAERFEAKYNDACQRLCCDPKVGMDLDLFKQLANACEGYIIQDDMLQGWLSELEISIEMSAVASSQAATIVVTDLPSPYNDGILTNYFKTFGGIADCATVKADSGRLIAYVNFDIDGVAAKVARETHNLEDEPLQIKLCFPPADAPDIHYESEDDRQRERSRAADNLALKGFSVSWLLSFWRKYGPRPNPEYVTVKTLQPAHGEWKGIITKTTSTNEVVRDIVIPETAPKKCCYMDLEGGTARKPAKLVSHWWGASFYGDVLCVIQDATELNGYELEWFVNHDYVVTKPPTEAVLNTGYWMCIFGVNQHVSICGMCNDCDVVSTTETCRICNRKLYNPCVCGSPKYKSGHVFCQMDKFDMVMEQMPEGLAVALDSKLVTTTRVWVVSEIGKSLDKGLDISWRMPNDIDRQFCTAEEPVIHNVRDCQASLQADKDAILKQIENTEFGIEGFDSKVSDALLPVITNFALWKTIADDAPAKLAGSILERRGDANYVGAMQRSVLFEAAKKGAHDVVVSLLEHRASASLDRQDSTGASPVFIAAEKGFESVVTALCSAKADTNQANNAGATPLKMAAQIGHDSVIAALCSAKADTNRAANNGFTPVNMAAQKGHDSIVAKLISAQADINLASSDGITPTRNAAAKGHDSIVAALISAQADINLAGNDGKTAYDRAKEIRNTKIMDLLKAAGAR